jgi:hypothetical protein
MTGLLAGRLKELSRQLGLRDLRFSFSEKRVHQPPRKTRVFNRASARLPGNRTAFSDLSDV